MVSYIGTGGVCRYNISVETFLAVLILSQGNGPYYQSANIKPQIENIVGNGTVISVIPTIKTPATGIDRLQNVMLYNGFDNIAVQANSNAGAEIHVLVTVIYNQK